jgi:NAD(P)-dependent dehydrogenase (short-subunit alcohol dehydrogenase family)
VQDKTWKETIGVSMFSTKDIPDLTGKIALITGGNSGLGFETAKQLYAKNCQVYITGRNEQRLIQALQRLEAISSNAPKPSYLVCDQQSLKDVQKMAMAFHKLHSKLDILVCNAGLLAPQSFAMSTEGLDYMLVVNHLSHFLLIDLLLPLVETAGSGSRIVLVSSFGHNYVGKNDVHFDTFGSVPVLGFAGYTRTKLFNLLHGKQLSRYLKSKGIHVNICHPGATYTEAVSSPNHDSVWFNWFIKAFANLTMFVSTEIGALSLLYCAASEEITNQDQHGEYFGPTQFTALLWTPSQTEKCSVSNQVNEENMELCWKKSIETIQKILPEWQSRL